MLLTDTKIKNTKLRDDQKEKYISDGLGLYLRLRAGGLKTWVFRYTYAGKADKVFLGSYPEVSLATARERRFEQAKILEAGQNPRLVKGLATNTKREALTVEQLGEEFFERWLKKHKRKPDDAYERLKRDPIRVLGKVLAMDVTPEMLTKRVFNPMVDRDAKVAANRTLALTRQLFDYAVAQHVIAANPVTMNQKAVGGPERSKKTNLSFEQIKEFLDFMLSLRNPMSEPTKFALLTVLGTAKRPLEVVTLEWEHLQLDRGVWVNPWWLTKDHIEGKDHVVFLSQWMVKILKHVKGLELSDKWVFPSPQNNERRHAHLTRHALSEAVLRLHDDDILKFKFTPHDLRRTFATRAANLKIGPHIVEKCLDHVMTGMMAVYNQADYFEERQQAMETWGAKLAELHPL